MRRLLKDENYQEKFPTKIENLFPVTIKQKQLFAVQFYLKGEVQLSSYLPQETLRIRVMKRRLPVRWRRDLTEAA